MCIADDAILELLRSIIVASAFKNINCNIIARARVATKFIKWRSSRALVLVAMNIDTRDASIVRENSANRLGIAMEVYNNRLIISEIIIKVVMLKFILGSANSSIG